MKFLKWKAQVENEKVKVLATEMVVGVGGEYLSTEVEQFPKIPEKNGVVERMNLTLVESVRSMFSDAQLPSAF